MRRFNDGNGNPAGNVKGGDAVGRSGSGNQTGRGEPGGRQADGVLRFPGGGIVIPLDFEIKRTGVRLWAFAIRMVMIHEGTRRTVDPSQGTQVDLQIQSEPSR